MALVDDAVGRRLDARERGGRRGERVEFSAAPPYAVTIGKASAVQVKLRGRAYDVASVARNDVARFDAK